MSQKERHEFNLHCLNYPPRIWQLALYLKKVYGIGFKKMLFDKAFDYLEDFDKASLKYPHINILDRYIIEELRFEGWVPLNKYKMRDKFAYIMTNRKLESDFWVYPVKLSDNYETMKKGKHLSYQEVFGKVGFPGLTKLSFSYEH